MSAVADLLAGGERMAPPRPARPDQVSSHFPPQVRDALVAAAQLGHPTDRVDAIDHVVATAKTRYPQLFRKES